MTDQKGDHSLEQNAERKKKLMEEAAVLGRELCRKLDGMKEGEWKELKETFYKCFVNTVDTTVQCLEDGSIFIITGDIEAMWMRDSSAQVAHYIPFLKNYQELSLMVRDLIWKQFMYLNIDTYANAFNAEPNGKCWAEDETQSNDWEWERKYEIDSLCYPVKLLYDYYHATGDDSVFTDQVKEGLVKIVETFVTELHHDNLSAYSFRRENCPVTDTLACEGKGSPVAYTGMVWCGFRPSDDACEYGYHIPSNLFAARSLAIVAELARSVYKDKVLEEQAIGVRNEIQEGIRRYGIIEHESFGDIYAYEVDGLGSYLLMDDANVPSLLSLPWLGCCEENDEIYRNTRRFVLSSANPFYYEGTAAKGIGSPHTPPRYIWPIALSMQGLTSADAVEQREILGALLSTDAGTGYMHEGFDCDDPGQFTREWFAWSNSLFALFVTEKFIKVEEAAH